MGRRRSYQRRERLTAKQRAQFARERRALVGKLITQEPFVGALVAEHIFDLVPSSLTTNL